MDEKDKRIAELEAEIRVLRQRLEQLERRLGLNSKTSSKPPSSDGLRKPSPKSLRTSTKIFGGQKGHKGSTLRQVPHPDQTINIKVNSCSVCHQSLESHACETIVKRQVFEVEIKHHVVEYQAEVKICSCGKRNVADFPEQVRGQTQYGNCVKALGIYFMNHFVPKERCSQIMNDLFKIPVSDTALMKFERECASNLTHCYEAIRKALGEADLKHADETGLRVEKSLHWLHVLCNKLMTYFQVDAKRGMAWDKLRGTIVHDHWKPYYQIQGVTHALCNAHHLRELSACVELDKESWAQEMFDVLLKALNDPKRDIEDISKRYDEIVNQGLVYHEERLLPNHAHRKKARKRSGHNLVIRLRDYKADTLRFLTSEGVPFTNNQAEQDIRMVKVRQKVSGCFRSAEGAMEFAKIRSVLSTARKQGLDLLEQLRLACSGIYPPEILVPT